MTNKIDFILGATTDIAINSADLPVLTSALQTFSSVGGLALLAEHLPLLYPDFSRQAASLDVTRDPATSGVGMSGNVSGFGHDWVTVESAEEIYEVFSQDICCGCVVDY